MMLYYVILGWPDGREWRGECDDPQAIPGFEETTHRSIRLLRPISREALEAALERVSILSACGLFGGPRYVVFFNERSAQLDSPAQRVIAQVAAHAKDNPSAKVEVAGYTDSAGSPAADVLLSKQRATALADALEANGVAAGRLVLHGRGQTGGNPGVESRRVDISIDDP
jgi:hypothetical protein